MKDFGTYTDAKEFFLQLQKKDSFSKWCQGGGFYVFKKQTTQHPIYHDEINVVDHEGGTAHQEKNQ